MNKPRFPSRQRVWNRIPVSADTLRVVQSAAAGVGAVAVFAAMFADPAAASTNVNDLELMQVLNRIHKILRNIAYLLGPIVLLHGLLLYFISSENSGRSEDGLKLAFGGAALFGSALALDIVLQAVVWIASNGI